MRLQNGVTAMRWWCVAVLAAWPMTARAANMMQGSLGLTSPCGEFVSALYQAGGSDADRNQNGMFVGLIIANAHVNAQANGFDAVKMVAGLLVECRQQPSENVTTAAHIAAERLGYSFIHVDQN